jgi:hypothetical protein
MANSIGIF